MGQKQVYNQFNGGLSIDDREGNANQFSVDRDLDLYRNKGYLNPINALYNVGKDVNYGSEWTLPPTLDIISDNITPQAFALGNNGTIYRIKSLDTTPVIDTNFNGGHLASGIFDTCAGMIYGRGLLTSIAGVNNVFFAYKTAGSGMLRRIINLSSTPVLNTTYKSLSSGSQVGETDIIEWNGSALGSSLWITSGRYIDQYVMSTDTIYTSASGGGFDLGDGWSATCLFTNQNYLGIFATKKQTIGTFNSSYPSIFDTQCYIIDGSSTTQAIKMIPLTGINKVYACANVNGDIYFLADSRKSAHVLCKLTDTGYQVVRDLQIEISGVLQTFYAPPFASAITVFNNKLLFGVGNYPIVFCYDIDNDALTFIISDGLSGYINAVKNFTQNGFFVSLYTGSINRVESFSLSGNTYNNYTASSNAIYKGLYTDLGQKVSVNYIKVYFRPLVSGDSITVTLDTNYGTSNIPQTNSGIASYVNDGIITFKKFDLGGIDCHSFRPCVAWNSGRVSISKIVVDYDFIED